MFGFERIVRENALVAINNNAKNIVLRLQKNYTKPYNCWTKIKNQYEAHNGPQVVGLMYDFIFKFKYDSVTTDTYLIGGK